MSGTRSVYLLYCTGSEILARATQYAGMMRSRLSHRGGSVVSPRWFVGCASLAVAALMPAGRAAERPIDGWPVYGHDAGGMRHSPLTDITRRNVGRLAVAWTFRTGDMSEGGGNRPRSGFETTPIVVDDTLFFTTATNRIIA